MFFDCKHIYVEILANKAFIWTFETGVHWNKSKSSKRKNQAGKWNAFAEETR